MKRSIQLTTIIPSITKPISLIAVLLVCFALSPITRAVSPAPDGGYPNFNTAEGDDALLSLTTGVANTALGFDALYNNNGDANTASGDSALYLNTTGNNNTATGADALYSNTTGNDNTAAGFQALASNTTGNNNTATGVQSLFNNTAGVANTATGVSALYYNTFGSANTATGVNALLANTTGNDNTANGDGALFSNTTGDANTATGVVALESNTTGVSNTATGGDALVFNTTGSYNTANGDSALSSNTTGNYNTASGFQALQTNTTGTNNIALGYQAGINLTTGDQNIDIGNAGVAAEASTIRIGTVGTQTKAYMAGIYGVAVAKGVAVVVDSSGHLGSKPSAERFKDAIKPMDKTSEAILALKPVTFHYKKEFDPEGIPQFGLVAEDVAKVNPDLVVRDNDGKIYTVRYDAVNAMLLNEFLKEHQKVQKLEAALAAVNYRLKEQDAKIDKVNAKVELTKPAPQTADNR